jgi:hypothetical protein
MIILLYDRAATYPCSKSTKRFRNVGLNEAESRSFLESYEWVGVDGDVGVGLQV